MRLRGGQDRRRAAGRRHRAHDLPGRRLRPARRGRSGAPGRDLRARVPERPVQVLWSREEDIRHDFYRPMALARWRAELDVSAASPPKLASVAKRQVGAVADRPVPGARDRPAGAGQARRQRGREPALRAFRSTGSTPIVADGSVPVGFWRSVGHSHTAFFDESFVDELALALAKDPFEFRRDLLADKPRHLKVLETAAKEAGWGTPLPAGIGPRHCAARLVRLDRGAGRRSRRGRRQDACRSSASPAPSTAARWSIPRSCARRWRAASSTACRPRSTARSRWPTARSSRRNFPDYDAVRLADAPAMSVHLVDSGASVIGGVGEPGTPPIAPAVANAVFAATGKRLRSLPLRSYVLESARSARHLAPPAQRVLDLRTREVACSALPAELAPGLGDVADQLGRIAGRRGPTVCGTARPAMRAVSAMACRTL